MKQIFLFSLSLIPGLWLHLSEATIEPAKDARSYFAAEFYRRMVYDLEKDGQSIAVSPAGAQKLLTTLYQGMEAGQADRLLFDYGVKHIDMQRLKDDVEKETGTRDFARSPHLRDKQMKELAVPIEKNVVTDYFKRDFDDTKDSIEYENFIVAPSGINAKDDYKNFARDYFNTHVINDDSSEVELVKQKFGDLYKASDKVDIFSNIELKTKIKNSYPLGNGNINAIVEVKYYEDDDFQFIVLPLTNGMKLFVAIAKEPKEFRYFISQVIGRMMVVFEEYQKKNWSVEKVLVNLPKALRLENINDLSVHFRKITREGLKQALKTNAKLSEGYENFPENGANIDHIYQRVVVEIVSEDKNDAINGPPAKTFDAVGKNIFYAVYDDIDYYVIGHQIFS